MRLGELSPAELRRALAGLGLTLAVGPFTLRVRSRLPALARGLAALYADFSIAERPFVDFHVRLDRPRGPRRWLRPQVWFDFDGQTPFKPLPAGQELPMFEWCVNWVVANHAHQYLIIHAAIIERGGRAAVLPAPPGSGKSTLAAALVSRGGWRLLSDELCMIDTGTGLITPLPRPVSLKNESINVIQAFAPGAVIGPPSHDTTKGTVAHLRPPRESVERAGEPAAPAWVVFPKWRPEGPALLTPREKPLAFLQLADHAFNYSLLGDAGFRSMSRLLDACGVYDFTYSRLDEALGVFERLAQSCATTPAAAGGRA